MTAHERIEAILAARGITEAAILDRREQITVGGPNMRGTVLRQWSFAPGTVAAILELVTEAPAPETTADG